MSEATIPMQAAGSPRLSEDVVAVGLGLGVFLRGRPQAPILFRLD